MKSRYRTAPRMIVALIVAVTIATIWVMVGVACMSRLEHKLQQNMGYEFQSLRLTYDGTPLIESQTYGDYSRPVARYRTLDGQVREIQEEFHDSVAHFPGSQYSQPLFSRTSWVERIAGVSDLQRPGVDWYLVRPIDPLGPAYFIGYDPLFKRRVGYIGKAGFRTAMPPKDEWFNLPSIPMHLGAAASSPRLAVGARASIYSSFEIRPAPKDSAQFWQVFLIDGDRLLEVDLRTRGVRTLIEKAGLKSVTIINELAPEVSRDRLGIDSLAHVAVRTSDQIVILNPATEVRREFSLPEELRDVNCTIYLMPGDKLIASKQVFSVGGGRQVDLMWLANDGSVERRETARLATPPQFSLRQIAWLLIAVLPFPIGWLVFFFAVFPQEPTLVAAGPHYSERLASIFGQVWPAVLVIVAIGILLVWFTYRLQRKYRRSSTFSWCVFVLLLGVPGLIAYIIEHRRPNLEECRECKSVVPRDREACADCDTLFPAPRLTGTEIFA